MIVATANTPFGTHKVEIEDSIKGGPITSFIVRALTGEPFVGGKIPTRTRWTIVPRHWLTDIEVLPECSCVLPEQHCRMCERLARWTHSAPEDLDREDYPILVEGVEVPAFVVSYQKYDMELAG